MQRTRYFYLLLLLLTGSLFAADNSDYTAEVARTKKELAQVRAERQRVRQAVTVDLRDFEAYRQRTAVRRTVAKTEFDSLQQQLVLIKYRQDSLAAESNRLSGGTHEYELQQQFLREALISTAQLFLKEVAGMPPPLSPEFAASLTYLVNDCRTKNIDNIEALHRLLQIADNIEEQSRSIVVTGDVSAAGTLRGSLSQIRIGLLFCAVVDENNERCALWAGNDSIGQPRWNMVDDKALAQRVRLAILVRQGKAVPQFVDLPLGTGVPKGAGQ